MGNPGVIRELQVDPVTEAVMRVQDEGPVRRYLATKGRFADAPPDGAPESAVDQPPSEAVLGGQQQTAVLPIGEAVLGGVPALETKTGE